MNITTKPGCAERLAPARPSLQQGIEHALRGLGYEICGDDDNEGWYWRLEDYDSRQTTLAEDRIEDATAAAVLDLVSRTQELMAAASAVVERWDRGDLAEAVRELHATLLAMRSESEGAPTGLTVDRKAGVVPDSTERPISHRAWLVSGTAPDGPWNEEAYLDQSAAIARSREIAEVWQAEGLSVDFEQLEEALANGRDYCVSDEFSVSLGCIEVIGDTAALSL